MTFSIVIPALASVTVGCLSSKQQQLSYLLRLSSCIGVTLWLQTCEGGTTGNSELPRKSEEDGPETEHTRCTFQTGRVFYRYNRNVTVCVNVS